MDNTLINNLYNRLAEVESQDKRREALSGFGSFILVALAIVTSISVLNLVFDFNSSARTFLFWFCLITISLFLFLKVLIPFAKSFSVFSKPDYFSAAKKVGAVFHEIKDELLNAFEIRSAVYPGYSADLIAAAFNRIYKRSEPLDFRKAVDFRPAKGRIRIASIITVLAILLFFIFPDLSASAYRIINYDREFLIPQKFYLQIFPGDREITKGDDISIRVSASGKVPNILSLYTKSNEQTEFEEVVLNPDSSGIFNYTVRSVVNSFEYYAASEGIESDRYSITVINRPIITQLDLAIIPPAYSGLAKSVQRDNGNISALPGSRIEVSMEASRDLSDAVIMFGDSSQIKMRVDETNASTLFSVYKASSYSISIKDNQGVENSDPIRYSIEPLSDRPPEIELISPVENIKLGTDGRVAVISKISDDYGFTSLQLKYRLIASKYREPLNEESVIPVAINSKRLEDEVYYVWDLMPLYLAEGEAVSFYLEIFDNDEISGPKSARTPAITVFVPSIDELYRIAENSREEADDELTETIKDAEELNRELKKIGDDLKQNSREISWQEKERVEKASRRFEELMEKAGNIEDKLSKMRNDLMQNNLLSEETLQKYNELQDLLEQLNSEELSQAFKRMEEALKSLMRDNVQISLDQIKANEEYFRKSLERTLNLLKRVQIEQKLDELIKRADDLSEKIGELSQKTDQANINDRRKQDELAERQNDLTENLNQVKSEMEKLDRMMNDLNDMPREEMEKLLEEFNKQENIKLSEEAVKNLQKMQKSEALRNQQQLSKNVQSSREQMESLRSALQQMNQMKTFYEMMKILDDLLALSKNQENLKNESRDLSGMSSELSGFSRRQSEIQGNLSRILQKMTALSQKTFAITPEMGKALGKAYSEMQQSITWMQNGNPALSAQRQTEAMRSLNETAGLMKRGMDQMMSGGQGGGMMGMMQQLQQMAQQQMDLNRLTQMLNRGQMSQEMMAQMERLAGQQELIRKSLEELNREAVETGRSKLLAANLEKILEEMKEVVTNLQSEKLDDDIIKQQERILSKLLDAQRSINERDFEKERKSSTGRDLATTSPPKLILSTEEGKNRLRDELMKAIREGYRKDYEDLIRKYFEALEKENR